MELGPPGHMPPEMSFSMRMENTTVRFCMNVLKYHSSALVVRNGGRCRAGRAPATTLLLP